ncbi:hypothetical protein ACFQ1E_08770 [Sphingomonas canadensis]|uniref:Uncharacterized protein n=1 Tax=Sphingomonas canadensis TaxID=1219257 RepID=A0ABW3H6J1_9SPHN|nr:hypothetical protein [Sphingomonas canadensis]MCW3836132.1 hypothetical protein [Sphingomonas canadensis]
MDNVPATVTQGQAPARRGGALDKVKQGTLRALGKVRSEAGEAIEAAGVSVERLHRRLILVAAGLLLMIFLGALARSLGAAWINYVLIALFGLGALYAFVQPWHVAGILALGGGVALARDMGTAGGALLGYAKLLGRVFLALLIPLLLFALAPGDASLASSLPFVVLAPVVVLAMWLFGRIAPGVEKFLFVALPMAALLISVVNMLIPERMLAALGVPAWLRTARPQDDELARLESAIERRKNEQRAAQLREIRRKIETGEALSAADEAVVAAAKQDRVTLTGWIDGQLKALSDKLGSSGQAAAAPKAPPLPPPGTVAIPDRGWSTGVAVPAGFRLCQSSNARVQCHASGAAPGVWRDAAQCGTVPVDAMRFRSKARGFALSYSFVAAGSACPSR